MNQFRLVSSNHNSTQGKSMQKLCTVSRILIPFVQSDWYGEIFMRVFLCAVVFTRHINKWSKMRNYDSIQQHPSRRPSTGMPCWSSVVTWSELCIISFQAWTHPATRQANVLPALGIKLRRDLSCLEFIIHDGWNCALKTLLYTGVCATQPRPPHTHTHLDERMGCHDAFFHLFLMSVVGQCAGWLSRGSDWETNRNQKPVVWGVPEGVIHFLLTFPFYVFFSSLSAVAVCRERQPQNSVSSQMKSSA